jgi:signal transduction histidine kinase
MIAVVAVIVMGAFAALIVLTVLDAQTRGRRALERQKVEQVDQLAASMDARLEQLESAFDGIAALPWELRVGSETDQAILDDLLSRQPNSRTGSYAVDAAGRVTAGTLLLDREVIGTRPDVPGLDDALDSGTAGLLPVSDGLTTASPVIPVYRTLTDAGGAVRGVFVTEAEVTADSAFSQEVSALGNPQTGDFFFVDSIGTVVASSDVDQLANRFDDERVLTRAPGFERRGDDVTVVADIPSAGWRAVFRQNADDFEGGLGQRLQVAVLLIVLVGVAAAGLTVIVLLTRLRAAREEQRRLAEINQSREEFISIVSHELRTPVAGVIGFLQTTLDHWDALSEGERRETVSRAAVNARRLQTLTRDVLDVSSAEQGTVRYSFGPVDLREEVAAAVSAVRDANPGRELVLDGATSGTWVNGDGDRIMQVVTNLLNNAVASSPMTTPITVTIDSADGEVVVSVVDRGPGLSDDEKEAVFEKFVRGRTAGVRGTGLGLYLARQIITAHGGRIWAETGDGAGATFRFALPSVPAPSTAQGAAPAEEPVAD